MKARIAFVAVCTTVAAGCTTYSGPTYNTDIVKLANGTEAYRVQCQGLFDSSKSCQAQVRKICADKPVREISSVDRAASGFKPEGDPREMMFTCSAPVAQEVTAPPAVQAAPTPEAKPISVSKLTLQGDTNFAINSSELTGGGRQTLDKLIEASREADIDRLAIAGYTDSTGSTSLNNRLSLARARSVHAYLASHGLRAAHYDVHGYGSGSPVASNATAAGRAKNRRVEIQIVGG